MITTIDNFITTKNLAKIWFHLTKLQDKFKNREGASGHGCYMSTKSKFSTLYTEDMPDALLNAIFDLDNKWDANIRFNKNFIQIQRYNIGEYIVPHKDNYTIKKLHLITLTTSSLDGLTCENGLGSLEFIPDVAGRYIDFPYDAAHWVNPVREHKRYSLVVGE